MTQDIPYLPTMSPEAAERSRGLRDRGVFPSQKIQEFIDSGKIGAAVPLSPKQVQPASLDLRLGPTAHRVRASFLPDKFPVEERIRQLGMTEIDLRSGAVLEKRCVYIVPLLEELRLPDDVSGKANPKSTTGRLDILTRLFLRRLLPGPSAFAPVKE
jgi:dCTP deaminase